MSGPRDPTPYEGDQFKQAVEQKNAARLQDIVCNLYPNVLWGSVTRGLSEADRTWAMSNLQPATEDAESY